MLLRQIQHFQAIVEENSFTEAAERCHISQSGISQSIKALEAELGVRLIERRNRGFELTEAGEFFYKRSLVITADIQQLCRETVRIAKKDAAELSLGVLSTYSGDEFSNAVALFAEQHPDVQVRITSGNHEELFVGIMDGSLDLTLSDQRRAFSDLAENLILKNSICYVEIATFNPLSKLESVSVEELKNTPCILIASPDQEEEERRYYHDIIGFNGDFIFVRSLQEARVMVVADRGVLPVEGGDNEHWFGASMKRLPLTHGGELVRRNYCAFWRKDNPCKYTAPFAEILKSMY